MLEKRGPMVRPQILCHKCAARTGPGFGGIIPGWVAVRRSEAGWPGHRIARPAREPVNRFHQEDWKRAFATARCACISPPKLSMNSARARTTVPVRDPIDVEPIFRRYARRPARHVPGARLLMTR